MPDLEACMGDIQPVLGQFNFAPHLLNIEAFAFYHATFCQHRHIAKHILHGEGHCRYKC